MALVTIQRSPSPSNSPAESEELAEDDEESSPRQRSFSESYFAVKGAALILPQNDNESFYTRKKITPSSTGEIESHLQSMFSLLRPQDTIKLAVKLESSSPEKYRYMTVVSCIGRQDTEESVILGINCNESASIGIVLSVWADTNIKLDGDGGFIIRSGEKFHTFKPVSVQAMWSALQSLNKMLKVAHDNRYISSGLTHTWVGFYESKIAWERRDEWINYKELDSLQTVPKGNEKEDPAETALKTRMSHELRKIMMKVDLDEATSKSLREALEEVMQTNLKGYRNYFDSEMIRILGQSDAPSKIKDYLYLGSEWNASNLEELLSNGVDHILNVTREIDNFFPAVLKYMNIREFDSEDVDLMKYWEDTYKFIANARLCNSKVLVHCKRGISRSASTVMAYLMKEYRMSRAEAFEYVCDKRSIAEPNRSFWAQLETYEGILKASNKREVFRQSKSEENLMKLDSPEGDSLESEIPKDGHFLGDDVYPRFMHHSVSTPGNLDDGHLQLVLDKTGMEHCGMEADFELSSRSSDSADYFISVSSPDSEKNMEGFSDQDVGADEPGTGTDNTEVIPKRKKQKTESQRKRKPKRKDIAGKQHRIKQKKVRDDGSWIKDDDKTVPEETDKAEAVIKSENDNSGGENATDECAPPTKMEDNSKVDLSDVDRTTPEVNKDDTDHYSKENIPWNPGTVKKTKEDLELKFKESTIGTENSDEIVICVDGVPLSECYDAESAEKSSQSVEPVKNIEGVTTTESCDSHELESATATAELDSEIVSSSDIDNEDGKNSKRSQSVYELEDIKLPPGIVRRTTQEIEDRNQTEHRISDGSKIQLPLQRSSSLKSQRDTPRKKPIDRERRKTCTPILSPSQSSEVHPTKDSPSSPLRGSPKMKARNLNDVFQEPDSVEVPKASDTVTDGNSVTELADDGSEPRQTEAAARAKGDGKEGDADVAVYKLMGEDVPVQKDIVQKQKEGIEQMNRDRKSSESKDIQPVIKSVSLPATPSGDDSDKTIISSNVSVDSSITKEQLDLSNKSASEPESEKHSANPDVSLDSASRSKETKDGAKIEKQDEVNLDASSPSEKTRPSITEIKSNFEKGGASPDQPKSDPKSGEQSDTNESVKKLLVSERKENFEKGIISQSEQSKEAGSPVKEQSESLRPTSRSEKTSSKMDSETLEMIREIGLAFLNSPGKCKGDTEQGQESVREVGLVRSLAKNIEQRTMKKKPTKEIIIIDKEAQERKKRLWRFSSPAVTTNENVTKQSHSEVMDTSGKEVISSKQPLIKSVSSPVFITSVHKQEGDKGSIERSSITSTPDNSPPKLTKFSDLAGKPSDCSKDTVIDSDSEHPSVKASKVLSNVELSEDHIDKVSNLVGKFECTDSRQSVTSPATPVANKKSDTQELTDITTQQTKDESESMLAATLPKESETSQISATKESISDGETSSGPASDETLEFCQIRQSLRKTPFCSSRPKSADIMKRKTTAGYTQKLYDQALAERSHSVSSPSSPESQFSLEGRKVRKMQGKSHPLTKLANRRNNPFYNTM